MVSTRTTDDPPPLPDAVDGVLIGGGHNSLVTAAYLARCGLSVLVLEHGDRLGGGVTTEEVTLPGFRHNLHAFFVRWTPDDPVFADLDLGRTGVRTLQPEVQNALMFDDGDEALLTYRDVGRSLESIARLSATDAEAYGKAHDEYRELVHRVVTPMRFSPPRPADEERALLRRSALGRRFLDVSECSALELVTETFTCEPVRALVAFNVAVRGYLPVMDQPGTGYCALMALPNSHEGRMVVGGSEEMIRALTSALHAAGGQTAVRSPVASIDVVDGRAVGVTTAAGRTVRARRFVASGVPAPLTLLDLVGPRHLDVTLVEAMRAYRWLEEGLFGVHLALEERPRFTAETRHPDVPRALNLALGYECSDDLLRDQTAVNGRRLSDSVALHASIPTVNDPSQAPPGRHTAFGWQFVASYEPDGADRVWDAQATRHQAELAVATFARYAPTVETSLLATAAHSPTDTHRMLPSMPRGDRHHGSYHPDNWAGGRPHPSLSGYRTPIDGLYLCGSTQHPGGSFTGHPGYNAAGVIADDLGLDVWWNRPDVRTALVDLE